MEVLIIVNVCETRAAELSWLSLPSFHAGGWCQLAPLQKSKSSFGLSHLHGNSSLQYSHCWFVVESYVMGRTISSSGSWLSSREDVPSPTLYAPNSWRWTFSPSYSWYLATHWPDHLVHRNGQCLAWWRRPWGRMSGWWGVCLVPVDTPVPPEAWETSGSPPPPQIRLGRDQNSQCEVPLDQKRCKLLPSMLPACICSVVHNLSHVHVY